MAVVAVEYAEYEVKAQLKLYSGSVPKSEHCSGFFMLVLATTERRATDIIWDEVRKTFFGVIATTTIHISEVEAPFRGGRMLCKIIGGSVHALPE